MRTIRVKTKNQAAIMDALRENGYAANPTAAPLSMAEYEANNFAPSEDHTFLSLDGMSGIETDASGHQAHKIIELLNL